MSKTIIGILGLFLLLNLAAPTAMQAQFTYTTNNGVITLTKYTGAGGSVVISNFVTTIGNGGTPVFSASLTNVTIPASVTNIAEFAFGNCTGLTSVTIPAGATNIGIGAFYECTNLTSVTIPGNITELGSVFYGCTEAINFTIADGVTSIEPGAFEYCANMTSLTVPGSVTNIGVEAFYECTNLTSITICGGVTSIGYEAFADCSGLTSVYFTGNAPAVNVNAFIGVINMTVYYSPGTSGWSNVFDSFPAGLFPFTFTTNAGALAITGYAGSGESVVIPSAIYSLPVTSIGTNAFYGCTNLTGVIIPSGITSIGSNAFLSCANLVNVTIPASVTHIASYAFSSCTNLAGVYFESNAPVAASNVFSSDNNATVYYLPGTTGWSSSFANLPAVGATPQVEFNYEDYGPGIIITGYSGPGGAVIIPPLINGLPVTVIEGFGGKTSLTSLTILGTVIDIESDAFENFTSLTNVKMVNGITTIGQQVFYGCYNLAKVAIPGSVTSIGTNAFYGCSALTNITLPIGVASLEESAFSYSGLKSIMIPFTLTNIGDYAFFGCFGLTSITVNAENPVYSSLNGVMFNKNQTTLIQSPGGLSGAYTVPDSVTGIAQYAFEGCPGLTGVTIPNSVTSIGQDAFWDSGLTSVYFTGNAPAIDSTAFSGVNDAAVYYLPGTTGWPVFSTNTGLSTVLWNPVVQAAGIQNNQFGFNITGTNNFTVVVEACNNLANAVWIPLQTITLTNGSAYFNDPGWSNYSNRYYSLGLP